MAIPKFDPKELKVVAERPGFAGMQPIPVYDFPVTPKEGFRAALNRRPIWQITYIEQKLFCPRINPDNIARSFIYEAQAMERELGGGPDMFGIEWEYIPVAGGSMVRPGKPFMDDANEWTEKVVWPDIDSWDWAGAAKANEEYLGTDSFNCCWVMNGWYERLISMMDFDGAVVALIDEDQKDAVHAFFDKLSDFYIKLLGKYLEAFPGIDGFCIHDDWGSQKETFFSPATVAEMIVPYMRRVTDFLHSRGRTCELHSCGQIMKQIPNIIAAGWDSWSGQPMNDTHKEYELYGDKLLIGITLQDLDPAGKSEDEQRALAREFARRFCDPKKPSILNTHCMNLPAAFREELYIASRERYAE